MSRFDEYHPYDRAHHVAIRKELAIAVNNLSAGPQKGPVFEAAHARVTKAEMALFCIIRDYLVQHDVPALVQQVKAALCR